jgi:hypothetical protein
MPPLPRSQDLPRKYSNNCGPMITELATRPSKGQAFSPGLPVQCPPTSLQALRSLGPTPAFWQFTSPSPGSPRWPTLVSASPVSLLCYSEALSKNKPLKETLLAPGTAWNGIELTMPSSVPCELDLSLGTPLQGCFLCAYFILGLGQFHRLLPLLRSPSLFHLCASYLASSNPC